MEDTEIRLRLIEAAAQTPAVRQHLDHKKVSSQAHAIAEVWYNNFVMAEKAQPGKSRRQK